MHSVAFGISTINTFVTLIYCGYMKSYNYYLFDVDGTLIDTRELIYQCFKYTGKRFAGKAVPRELVEQHIGIPLRNQMELYFGPLSDERYMFISREHMRYQLEIYRDYLSAFPGVSNTLSELKSAGKKLAVVTSRRKNTLGLYLRETGLHDFFSVIITPESTERHKPDPEPAQKALSLLAGTAYNAVFIGDSIYDIECGARAGMDTAYVRWNGVTPQFERYKPTYIIEEMEELTAK
ncbi:MAG: HAD-IA family hydrolase [Chitinivibrionales bacterium]|nr:HAD-IA family hydrolase [Chitinivibrionales bacterium]